MSEQLSFTFDSASPAMCRSIDADPIEASAAIPENQESLAEKAADGLVVKPTVQPLQSLQRPKRRRKNRGPNLVKRVIMGMSILMLVGQPAKSVSLWTPDKNGLFDGAKRFFKNGDIITIVVNENTSAANNWKADRDKELTVEGTAAPTGNGAGTANLFGRFFPFMGLDYKSKATSDNKSARTSRLTATIAAEVVNVLPNGNLQIIARKVTRVNSEEQLIELSGNVRPEDVSADNVIQSRSVADATIKVNGTLRFSNDEKPSIIERVGSFLTGLFW